MTGSFLGSSGSGGRGAGRLLPGPALAGYWKLIESIRAGSAPGSNTSTAVGQEPLWQENLTWQENRPFSPPGPAAAASGAQLSTE